MLEAQALEKGQAFAACIQETWRSGSEELAISNNSFKLLGYGPKTQLGRGKEGVGILLSPSAYNVHACPRLRRKSIPVLVLESWQSDSKFLPLSRQVTPTYF